MSVTKQTGPLITTQRAGQLESDGGIFNFSHLTIFPQNLSTPRLAKFADLHDDLAQFYVDQAAAAADCDAVAFDRWYSRAIASFTYCELLRAGSVGYDLALAELWEPPQ